MQVTVLSGKGGTGKTTIAVGIAEALKDSIKIDCDVDAANMYLYYNGKQISQEPFYFGKTAQIISEKCIKCNKCIDHCRFDAIKDYKVDSFKCEGCGVCKLVCPVGAISFVANYIADIKEEKLDNGLLIRADMQIGADGSGKLISKLRTKVKPDNEIIIIDSAAGIGCPVIASITDTDICLVVTEPTLSGFSDLKRALTLIKSFKLTTFVCINKWDINKKITTQIKKYCHENDIDIIGLVPYDDIVIKSVNDLRPIIYYNNTKVASEIKKIATKIFNIYKENYL